MPREDIVVTIEKRLTASCSKQDKALYARAVRAIKEARVVFETLTLTRSALMAHLPQGPFKHKGYTVYQMNDCDWWASKKKTQQAVIEEYLAFMDTGYDPQLREDSEEPRALSQADLFCLMFNDEDGHRRTFMDEIKRAATEQKDGKGFFFASTEY